MKQLLSALIMISLLGTTGQASAQSKTTSGEPVEAIIRHLKEPAKPYVLVAAHRGDWRSFPENSLEAVESAIRMKVDIVEIDIQKTKDGHLVLMHDNTVDRVTDGKGKVSDFTLDSLRKLSLRNGLGRLTIYKIPTLEEVMVKVKGKVLVNLDKCYEFFPEAYEILQKTGTTHQVIMKGDKRAAIVQQEMGAYLKDVFYMPIVNLDAANAAEKIADYESILHPIAYEYNFKADTSVLLTTRSVTRKQGRGVWFNSLWPSLNAGFDDDHAVSDPDRYYGWLLQKGATILQTDRPAFLLDYLRSKKLHD